jgi:hypothetical protein
LEPVIAEVLDEVPLQQERGRVRDATAAEVRMDGELLEVRDPRPSVLGLEAHDTRTNAVDLDHEPAVRGRIGIRPLDLGGERRSLSTGATAEERLDVRVVHELDQEVEIVTARPPDRNHSVSAGGRRSVTVPSATSMTAYRRLTGGTT